MITRHRAWRGFGCACLLLIAGARGVRAQQSVAPEPVKPPQLVKLTLPELSNLRRIYATGDSKKLADAALKALADLSGFEMTDLPGAEQSDKCCDVQKHYFLVMFVAPDASGASGSTVVAILVHRPMADTASLPGLKGNSDPLYEVFFAEDLTATIRGTYTITHEENPALKQAADFASTFVTKLALPAKLKVNAGSRTTNTKTTTSADERPSKRPYEVAVTFNKVVFPDTGKVAVRQVVSYGNPVTHAASSVAYENAERAREYKERYGEEKEPAPSCIAFAGLLQQKVATRSAQPPCKPWVADPSECPKKIVADLDEAFAQYVAAAPKCPAGEAYRLLQAMARAAQDVKPVTATTSLGNTRQVRYGFGLAAGYLSHIRVNNDHPRVQIQNGKIAVDPFTRFLTMGVVNWTPWGYDSQTFSPAKLERFRAFTGAAFSPYFGATAGIAWELNRYLSINGGYVWLWFDTPKPGENVDAMPTAANKAAPFELRSTGAWLIGVGYNLK